MPNTFENKNRFARTTKQFKSFLVDFHTAIVENDLYRRKTKSHSEKDIQRELRSIMCSFLDEYWKSKGLKNPNLKRQKTFYWEGQEKEFGHERKDSFGSKNYPDFVILQPYKIAIEYKKSKNGSLVKQAIGQAFMHIFSGEYDYVYVLFHDEGPSKKILTSVKNKNEKEFLEKLKEFNIFVEFTGM